MRQALELTKIEHLSTEMQDVTGAMGLDRVLAERLAQVRDVPLDEIRGGRRRILAPQLVYEPAAGYDAVRLREQRDEYRALTRPSELHRAAVDDHLEWSEQPVLDRVHRGERTTRHIANQRGARPSLVVDWSATGRDPSLNGRHRFASPTERQRPASRR